MALATNSGHPADEVARAADGPKWLQTYFYRDREQTRELVARAEALGFVGICMTIDGHWPAKRQLATKGERRGGAAEDGTRTPLPLSSATRPGHGPIRAQRGPTSSGSSS